MNNKPYVVSADIYLLLNKWAKQKNFVLPKKEFFCELRKEFSNYMLQIFPYFELISEKEISEGMKSLINKFNEPVISLSSVYTESEWLINLTRMVDFQFKELGLFSRHSSLTTITQLRNFDNLRGKKVVLVDDVIFSGNLICRLIPVLEKFGIKTIGTIAGVGVNDGISKIEKYCQVYCVKRYNQVIDQVCERDFYPGTPYCGRSLRTKRISVEIGYPYIWPFGHLSKWASIPHKMGLEIEISKFCLEQTIKIFEAIEAESGKPVLYGDIDRKLASGPCFISLWLEEKFIKILNIQLDAMMGKIDLVDMIDSHLI